MTTKQPGGSLTITRRLLGVDTGGTFTDFIFSEGDRLIVLKLASTPEAPEKAVLAGTARILNQQGSDVVPAMVHGSTVATNALLEGKLARTAYVTNAGLADVLTLGRQARAELYNLQPKPKAPPVAHEWCLEVDQRSAADGSEVTALSAQSLAELVARLRQLAPAAIAINLLFSFKNEAAERRIEKALAAALPAAVIICRSSCVLPEYKEYERGIATWLNAGLGPLMQRYLHLLQASVPELAIMHGAAGTMDAQQAGANAAQLLLSGPAGGLLGARFVGRLAGAERLLSFDMGGTSTDVALIDCTADTPLRLTSESRIAGYPIAVPMVDMHTIGAGGGSIAQLDAGGMLTVGPRSAGATPGPACYGQGGTLPTVTDANVLLGRLPDAVRLGGELPLDARAARGALVGLAAQMGVTPEAAAEGVIRVANEAMVKALRVISVQRAEDPQAYTLLCFGGAGGMHVCALAQALGMHRALVPIYAGVLSALGMLVARRSRQMSQSLLMPLAQLNSVNIQDCAQVLFARGAAQLHAEGVAIGDLSRVLSVDLRYVGQSFALNVAWWDADQAARDFHAAHKARYGHALELPIEVVNLRLALSGPKPAVAMPKLARSTELPKPIQEVMVYGIDTGVPLFARADLLAGQRLAGPAIISESVSTTWLAPGWHCAVDDYGNLLLSRD